MYTTTLLGYRAYYVYNIQIDCSIRVFYSVIIGVR